MSAQQDLVAQWLLELNSRWGVNFMKLDSNKQCHLSVGKSKVSFAISDDEHEILLWSPITSAQSFLEDKELLTKLLIFNFDEVSLAGATLSIDSDRRYILLNYRLPINGLDAQALGELLCNFGEAAADAEKLLVNLITQRDPIAREPEMFSNHLNFMRP